MTLEEVDGDEVVVRIKAAPQNPADGPRLAGAVLATGAELARDAAYPHGDDGAERARR